MGLSGSSRRIGDIAQYLLYRNATHLQVQIHLTNDPVAARLLAVKLIRYQRRHF